MNTVSSMVSVTDNYQIDPGSIPTEGRDFFINFFRLMNAV